MKATVQNISFNEEISSGSSTSFKVNYEILSIDLPELKELPSISKTEESSITPSYEEIQKILQANKIINQQVRLQFNKFISKSNSLLSESKKKTLSTIEEALPKIEKGIAKSIHLSPEYLFCIKTQQETLLRLFDQLCILQQEIDYESIKLRNTQREIQKNRFPLPKFECSIEESQNKKSQNVCCCEIF
ncbi:hypothetical protein SteCoe_6562 [Stentor coeruleus]|uniref:Uncharacterized protein n=1 Tax=Stentor coeruleus TaxID=5963 RepID=A0A1R2CPU4_9CILI|nr:hypothetical protein SteCoe_6562 [Stentor coeruleus]